MEDYCKYQQSLMALELTSPLNITPNPLRSAFSRLTLNLGWNKTYYGLLAQSQYLKAKGQGLLALNLLIEGLEKERFWFNHEKKWWHLMSVSIMLAHALALYPKEQICLPLQRLMKLIGLGPQPWSGQDVAFCFANLSFWSFLAGKNNKAIEQIHIACRADKNWAYPEYLQGWYGLMLEGLDPIPHFVRAIKCNANYWHLLQHDPLIEKHRQVLQEVKKVLGREKKRKFI